MNWKDAEPLKAERKVPYEQHPLQLQRLTDFHTQLPNHPPVQEKSRNEWHKKPRCSMKIHGNMLASNVPDACETKLRMGL